MTESQPEIRIPKVVVTVKAIKGSCDWGYKVGDTLEITGFGKDSMKGYPICPIAQPSLWPFIYGLRYGVKYPYAEDEAKNIVLFCCPDPYNLVTFELKRVEEYSTFKSKGIAEGVRKKGK